MEFLSWVYKSNKTRAKRNISPSTAVTSLCVFLFFISSSSSSSLQCVGFISCVHLLRNEKEEGRKKLIYRWGGGVVFPLKETSRRGNFSITRRREQKKKKKSDRDHQTGDEMFLIPTFPYSRCKPTEPNG